MAQAQSYVPSHELQVLMYTPAKPIYNQQVENYSQKFYQKLLAPAIYEQINVNIKIAQ